MASLPASVPKAQPQSMPLWCKAQGLLLRLIAGKQPVAMNMTIIVPTILTPQGHAMLVGSLFRAEPRCAFLMNVSLVAADVDAMEAGPHAH